MSAPTPGGARSGRGGSGGVTLVIGETPRGTDPNGCKPLSCHPPGGDYCGVVGDGCGRMMDCGECQKTAFACDEGVCRGTADCQARTSCTEGAAKYCGKIGDDCGRELDCGDCTAPEVCGGNGVANMCGDPACVPLSCQLARGQYCGVVGDGCGRALDCGECPRGAVCGGEGIAGVCPGSIAADGCHGIRCNVETCGGGATTSLSGVVYDPAGVNPLYNVRVYVPNAPLEEIPTGATCEQCTANLTGDPITTTLSDSSGKFRLEGVPTGTNIPLVMQVGRWRRQVTIPNVAGCADNPITDRNLTRLPRNRSEGHIPLIAITTGGQDALECLIPRIGLDRSEVTTDTGGGRVHLYAGGTDAALLSRGAVSMTPGGALPQAATLWSSAAKMRGYDIVMFSCEGAEDTPSKAPYTASFEEYVNNGGRAFLTHFHYAWAKLGSAPFQGTANYMRGLDPLGSITATINTTFPKGAALADWLVTVGATPTRGQLQIYESKNSVTSTIPPTQDWISVQGNPPGVQYLTFNTPIGAPVEQQCGRVVVTDLHIAALVNVGAQPQGGDESNPLVPYPNGCSSRPMSPQTKALEFIFFDLAACVQPDFDTPKPPTPPPPTQSPPPPIPVPPPPPPPPPR